VLLEGGDIVIRLQSTTESHVIRLTDAVQAGTEYYLAVTFGPDGMKAWLDGALAGQNAYTGGLQGNAEPIVIGANQMFSGDLVASNLTDGFDGTIDRVSLYDQALSAEEIALLAGHDPIPDPANDAPTATDDALSVDADTPLVVNVASDLLANDSDANSDLLSLSSFTQPANGTLVDNGNGTLTYTPNASFAGADGFAYTLSDGNGGVDTATVAVTVVAPTPIPDPAPDPGNGEIGLEDLLVELWDAELDTAIATLGNGATLDLDLLASVDATISVTAVAGGDLDGQIGSIRLNVDDLYQNVESSTPYTLFGEKRGGDKFGEKRGGDNNGDVDVNGGLVLEEGQHTLQLEVFAEKNAHGTLLGDFEIDFAALAGEIEIADMLL
jgi:hypothetical protein